VKLFNNQVEQEYVKERFSFLLQRGYVYAYECLHYSIHQHEFTNEAGVLIRMCDDFRLHFVNLRIEKNEKVVLRLEYGAEEWDIDLKGLKETLSELKDTRSKYGKDRTFSHLKLSRAKFEVYARLIGENLEIIEG
jgi:hypothetical protein